MSQFCSLCREIRTSLWFTYSLAEPCARSTRSKRSLEYQLPSTVSLGVHQASPTRNADQSSTLRQVIAPDEKCHRYRDNWGLDTDSLESIEHSIGDGGMEEKENDDDCGRGSVTDLPFVLSELDPPHKERQEGYQHRHYQICQQIYVKSANCLRC